jgi:hypothetical protein
MDDAFGIQGDGNIAPVFIRKNNGLAFLCKDRNFEEG